MNGNISFVFFQHHEVLDVFLQPFSFFQLKKPNTMSKRLDIKKLGRETIPTLDSGASYSLWNHTLGWTSDSTSTERSVRYRVEHPTASYQEWDRDDNPFPSTGKPVREINQQSSIGKPVRGILNQFTSVKLDYHNFQVSDIPYIENVFMNVRQKLNRSKDDQMLDQRVSVLIWRSILVTTMKAAIHLGEIYKENLIANRNTNSDGLKTLFDITQRSISKQEFEMLKVSTIETGVSSTLLHDKVIKWAEAKVHVYSDSVLCLGRMQGHPEAKEMWKAQL